MVGYWLNFQPGILKNDRLKDQKRYKFDAFTRISHVNSKSSQWPKGKLLMSIYDNLKSHTDHWLFQIDNLNENVTVVMAGWTPEEVELYLKQSYNQIDLILPEDLVKVESVLSFKVSATWFISLLIFNISRMWNQTFHLESHAMILNLKETTFMNMLEMRWMTSWMITTVMMMHSQNLK